MLKPINIAEVHFQILEEIGLEGKNSKVFKAYDPQLKATLAIKKIQKQHFCDVTEYFNGMFLPETKFFDNYFFKQQYDFFNGFVEKV
jgi:serine/threonine protein kinase